MLGLEVLRDLLYGCALALEEWLRLLNLLAHRLHLLLDLFNSRCWCIADLILLEEAAAASVRPSEVLRLHLLHPHGLLLVLLLLQLNLDLLLHDGLLLFEVLADLLVDLAMGSLLQILFVHDDLLLL